LQTPSSIFIADDFHPSLMDILSKAGLPFVYRPDANRQEIITALQSGSLGLVIRSKTPVDLELLQAGKMLKFVARGGAGMDNIDESAAEKLKINLFNSGNANSNAVAEHALGMLLTLFRKINTADAEVRQGIWQREANRGIELKGKTIGIVGFGNTGSAFAKNLSGFDVELLAYDKFKKNYGNAFVKECAMDELYEKADILSFHVPLDCHTTLMVNSDYLQRFVRNLFLLNLSRGGIVNTIDVVLALENGKIKGFAADVLEHENPTTMGDIELLWFHKLVKMNNVLLTPHIGGWTFESYQEISTSIATQILAFMRV